MQLYSFFNSSAAWRVRIALALKGLAFESCGVNLRQGEQRSAAYLALNVSGSVPLLADDTGHAIGQSLAIIDYLDRCFAQVPLVPVEPLARARVWEVAHLICCDIHPLNNLRVMQFFDREWNVPQAERDEWTLHWMRTGFAALETMLAGSFDTGRYCHGAEPGLADCCLVPQLYNARRFHLDLTPYPTLQRIEEACLALPAFDAARPENQIDAV